MAQVCRRAGAEIAGPPPITAFAYFLVPQRKKIWSTNLLERLNMEIERRTDVVGVFP
jgi:hypothetical protein